MGEPGRAGTRPVRPLGNRLTVQSDSLPGKCQGVFISAANLWISLLSAGGQGEQQCPGGYQGCDMFFMIRHGSAPFF